MEKMYDLIIIGSGPAGLSAAVYAQRALLDTLVIEKSPMSGGQILNTYEVDNYLGLSMINGFDLGTKFREHADKLGAEFLVKSVDEIVDHNEYKEVKLGDGSSVKARAVIVATGAHYNKLNVPGEEELTGMGVSYCATCDGAFFRGRRVAVVGGGDVALEDAIFLAKGCEKVYVIHRRDEFRGAKILQKRLLELPNVEVIWDSTVDSINGKDAVEGITISNKKTGEKTNLDLEGVFIAIGIKPDSGILKGLAQLNEGGYVVANETGVTGCSGVFVAGDIREKELRQVITAASDGANAVFAVEKYLTTLDL